MKYTVLLVFAVLLAPSCAQTNPGETLTQPFSTTISVKPEYDETGETYRCPLHPCSSVLYRPLGRSCFYRKCHLPASPEHVPTQDDLCLRSAFWRKTSICRTNGTRTTPTFIQINGGQTVAQSMGGSHSSVAMKCDLNNLKWRTTNGIVIKRIVCLNPDGPI